MLITSAIASAGQAGLTGSLEGKLTDIYSRPLPGVTVVLRNAGTGSEYLATTSKSGGYRIGELPPGRYVLNARREDLGSGQIEGIVVRPGPPARVQTAITLRIRQTRTSDQALMNAPRAPVRFYPNPTAAPVPTPNAGSDEPARIDAPAKVELASASETGDLAPSSGGGPRALRPDPDMAAGRIASRTKSPPVPNVMAAESGTEAGLSSLVAGPRSAGLISEATDPYSPGLSGALLVRVMAASARAAMAAAVLETAAHVSSNRAELPEAAVTLTRDEVDALPIAGRSIESLRLDELPETAAGREENEAQEMNERLSDRAQGTVDGIDTRLAFGGRGVDRRGAASLIGPGRSESALQEMQLVERNGPPLELPASVASGVRTRSAGEAQGGRLHGQTSFFSRQNLLAAQNPFTQWVKESAAANATATPTFTGFPWTPEDRRYTLGWGMGGMMSRHRLGWFAAFDGERRDDPAVAAVKHPDSFFAQPSNDEMQVLSARLGLGSDPVTGGVAAYSKLLENLGGLLGPAARTSTRWTGSGRLDWNAAAKHHFTLEGTWARVDGPGGGLTRASETYGNHSFGASRLRETWVLSRWETVPTTDLKLAVQGSLGLEALEHPSSNASAFEQTFNVNPWGQLPQMVVDSRYGFTIGNPAGFGSGSYPIEHMYEASGTADWSHGRTILRGGLDLRHNADITSFLRNHTGTFHYSRLENFASDALVFAQFGLRDALDPRNQHNCDERGKAWRDSAGQLNGLGYLPCYSYYTQALGPTEWHLETNDWKSFGLVQWRPAKALSISAGLHWDLQQTPPPIDLVNNPELTQTGRLPNLGSEWGPRASLAWGSHETYWPVLRIGYAMLYGRTPNRILETVLTQTGSTRGDFEVLLRPTDNLPGQSGGAPPFPYVLSGSPGDAVKPSAVEMNPQFRNAEVHQGAVSVEEELPGRIRVNVTAMASLGRRLPVTADTNFDPAVNPGTITYDVVDASGKGPIKSTQLTVPFYASWPGDGANRGRLDPRYGPIIALMSRANSTYEAGLLQVSRSGRRGLDLHARYTYAHAMDWNPGYGGLSRGGSVLDPLDFKQEYGTSDLDVRHGLAIDAIWRTPWKVTGNAGRLANGWMLSGRGQAHSGLPYTMRTTGSLAEIFNQGAVIASLGPGMNGYGGDNRVYEVGRNTYRYPPTWKADVRLGKRFELSHARELDLTAESFNLFNHSNVTELETVGYYLDTPSTSGGLPRLNFLTGLKPGQTEFGQPLNINATDFYRQRQFDFGLRLRFKRRSED